MKLLVLRLFLDSMMILLPSHASNSSCTCAFTSGNRNSCCSKQNGAGEGTGDFCGSWFHEEHCTGDTPLCCTSDGTGQCCKAGSSCSPSCGFGLTDCGCIEQQPSSAVDQYSEVMVRAFASLTQASQCGPKEELKSWQCDACRKAGFELSPGSMQFIAKDGFGSNTTFAFVARIDDLAGVPRGCVLSIRGTKNFQDVVTDASFWQKSTSMSGCGDCEVHAGFYDRWVNELRPDVIPALEKAGCKSGNGALPVYVTGHSMGAAIGQLAMFDLMGKGFALNLTYNFESPRVGNAAFSTAFERMSGGAVSAFRVAHARDPVVHLPPLDLVLLDYTHAGPEAYYFPNFATSGEVIVCAHAEDPRCSGRYSLAQSIVYGNDHCVTPLIDSSPGDSAGRDICKCPLTSSNVVV
eukprot:TRINITY_DN57825_c0_g1_i1.p1 TRINITY_DN57825_c0_g1~~TRINITY_DN57825_c0_g1_i1.p1  ORF type:complete len:407 (+),score=57.26 TRINITY_DN57825_c0_g1_i1:127-1347(+)